MRRFALLLLVGLVSLGSATGLGVGSVAPAFKVATMVKGNTPDLSKGLHVVEFWATWCGPCKENIPHLTELARRYKGQVTVTGVDVQETGENRLGRVRKFVQSMGDKMDYNVAYDGDAKAMDDGFVKASRSPGIPTAFLVKDGQVIDIEVGYPMPDLEKTIGEVLAGRFDLAKAKENYGRRMAERAKYDEQARVLKPALAAYRAKRYDEAVKAFDKVKSNDPDTKSQVVSMRFKALVRTGSPRVRVEAKAILSGPLGKNSGALSTFAWEIVDPMAKVSKPDYQAALMLAEAGAKASGMNNAEILDTYALALFRVGRIKEAIEVQTKAVELAKADKNLGPETLKFLQGHLEMFKAA